MADLTPKQEKFAQFLEEGMNQSDAYRKAFDPPKSKDKTIHETASRLVKTSKIEARREEIRKPIIEKIGYSIEEHLERLDQLSKDAAREGQFTAAVSSEIHRGRCSGFYVERVDHTTNGESIAPTRIEIVAPDMDKINK